MKKLVVLLALFIMLMGCASSPSSSPNSTASTSDEDTTISESVVPEETVTTINEQIVIERGSINDNLYTNASINVNIEVPEGNVALSDEQLNSLVITSAESKGIENFQDAIDSQDVTYDFGMIDPTGNGSVLVGIENLEVEGAEGLVNNEEEYFSFVKASLVQNQGTEYTFSDIYDFQMFDDTWTALNAMDSANGVNSTIIVKCYGKYVVSIIYNYTATTDPSVVLSYIY